MDLQYVLHTQYCVIEGMVVGLELKQRNRLTKSDLKQQ